VAVGVVLGLAAVTAYALTLKRARDKAYKLKKGAQGGSATTVSSGSVSHSGGSGEPNTQQTPLQVVVEPQASQAADPWQAIMRRSAARQHTTGSFMSRVDRDAVLPHFFPILLTDRFVPRSPHMLPPGVSVSQLEDANDCQSSVAAEIIADGPCSSATRFGAVVHSATVAEGKSSSSFSTRSRRHVDSQATAVAVESLAESPGIHDEAEGCQEGDAGAANRAQLFNRRMWGSRAPAPGCEEQDSQDSSSAPLLPFFTPPLAPPASATQLQRLQGPGASESPTTPTKVHRKKRDGQRLKRSSGGRRRGLRAHCSSSMYTSTQSGSDISYDTVVDVKEAVQREVSWQCCSRCCSRFCSCRC
jgi:hypothetical protein